MRSSWWIFLVSSAIIEIVSSNLSQIHLTSRCNITSINVSLFGKWWSKKKKMCRWPNFSSTTTRLRLINWWVIQKDYFISSMMPAVVNTILSTSPMLSTIESLLTFSVSVHTSSRLRITPENWIMMHVIWSKRIATSCHQKWWKPWERQQNLLWKLVSQIHYPKVET